MAIGESPDTDRSDLRRLRLLARALSRIALLRHSNRRGRVAPSRDGPRVVHVSPCLFGVDGIVGGGERAAYGYARAAASELPTTLVGTGPRRDAFDDGDLRVEIYPSHTELGGQRFDPLCYRFLEQLRGADVVHCHQYRVAVSQLAILAAAAGGTRSFVTDYGGVGTHFDGELPVERFIAGLLPVSDFSLRLLPSGIPSQVIPTAVDERFLLGNGRVADDAPAACQRRVLYVGRIMRHKGIDVLVRGLPQGIGLDVVGHVYDEEFLSLLHRLAEGRDVCFLHDASDEQLVQAYTRALVTVLPSVYRDAFGGQWEMPELFGYVLQESMACGTPVICTNVGGMPEAVEHGVTGFVEAPSDPGALGSRIRQLAADRRLRTEMGDRARRYVLEHFTRDRIGRELAAAYRADQGPAPPAGTGEAVTDAA